MRRFVTLAVLLLSTISFGVSISGCKSVAAPDYCNGSDSGPIVGQPTTLSLQPRLNGISINQGQLGQVGAPSATDCKGNSASVTAYTYGSTNMFIADVNPSNGQICAGSWNRNSGAGIADYTTCTFTPGTNSIGTAYVTASASGVSSNPIAVYVHPIVTSIVLGGPSTDCALDPASNCVLDATQSNGCSTQGVISNFSIANNVVTFTAPNSFAAGTVVTIAGLSVGTYLDGQNLTVTQPVDTITGFSINNNVVTFTLPSNSNTLAAGTNVVVSGLSVGTYLNGQTLTVLSTGLTGNQFQVNFTHGNVTPTSDSGSATAALSSSQFEANFTHANVATTLDNGSASIATTISNYLGNACVSQGTLSQLAARVYQGTSGQTTANNISCLVGPLSFSAQNSAVVTVNQAGVATAAQPGTTIINANIAQSSSSAGLFSTCPPKTISLTVANGTATSASVNQNVSQNLTATVLDTNGVQLNNVTLNYVSTTPTTVQANSYTITPTYPGSASITALCQPPSCNPSPFNQIGLFGTGTPVVSNPVQITSPGTNSTVLYIASTQSQYIVPVDFTATTLGSPVRMPFVPNSMVIADNGSAIYMGTTTELMVFSPSSNSIVKEDNTVAGSVLSVSPDSNTVIVTDPIRQLVYLYSASGGVTSEIGGVGTHAQWSPDSSTVYITTSSNELLVHSTLLGWTTINSSTPAPATLGANPLLDVAVVVPSQGAYFAGATTTARTNCPYSTVSGANGAQVVSNVFYPVADSQTIATDRIAATNSGKHLLGATASTAKFTDFTLTIPTTACPVAPSPVQTFSSSPTSLALGVTPTAITGVLTTSDSDFGFVTYTGTGGTVPQYNVTTGSLTDLALKTANGSAAPIAPVAGTLSADDQTLYVGTTGDNLVHILTRATSGFSDSTTIAPALTPLTGTGTATPNLLVQRPRKSTT